MERQRKAKEEKFSKTRAGRAQSNGKRTGMVPGKKERAEQIQGMRGSCPAAKKCGGCQMQGVPYEEQLKRKRALVRANVGDVKVHPVIGMDDPTHYRNKVHAVFGRDRRGNVISGVYEPKSHRIVPVDACMIENRQADAIIGTIRALAKDFKIRIYDEGSGYGLLRHALVRTGYATGEILVVLVLASPILPSKNNFVKALLAAHPQITSIVLNVNERHTSMVLGERNIILYDIAEFVLPGEPCPDAGALREGDGIRAADRKGDGDRCVLRDRNDRHDRGGEGETGDRRGVKPVRGA